MERVFRAQQYVVSGLMEEEREAVRIPGDGLMPDARRSLTRLGTEGDRNAFKHDHYPTEAIARLPEHVMVRKIGAVLCLIMVFGLGWVGAAERPPSVQTPACEPNANFKVADFSMTLSTRTIDQIRRLGIATAFRYYDHTNETLPGKTLRASEAEALALAGLNIGVVFQHHNDDPAKFLIPDIGARDAERALELAKENKQPFGLSLIHI